MDFSDRLPSPTSLSRSAAGSTPAASRSAATSPTAALRVPPVAFKRKLEPRPAQGGERGGLCACPGPDPRRSAGRGRLARGERCVRAGGLDPGGSEWCAGRRGDRHALLERLGGVGVRLARVHLQRLFATLIGVGFVGVVLLFVAQVGDCAETSRNKSANCLHVYPQTILQASRRGDDAHHSRQRCIQRYSVASQVLS